MSQLSVLIPARNEEFLAKTIENILENIRGDTEIIVVCDGNWPSPPIEDHPKVSMIYHSESIGQRAATNEAAKLSTSKFIMKSDAHCIFDEGFDVKLMSDCKYDWTVVPRMFNLHAFNWKCLKCERQTYQGPKPTNCKKCNNTTEFEMVIIWKPKRQASDYMWFNRELKFQYFDKTALKSFGGDIDELKKRYHHKYRDWAKDEITDQMTSLGACWLMHQGRFWDLGGLDERHGSWGQMGVEIACKSWLSGGRQVVNKKTWFAHMFRTQSGFGFPYSNRGTDKAKEYSKNLWLNDKWEGAKHPLSWMIDKFSPLPDWEELDKITKGLVYYTDNRLDNKIFNSVQKQLEIAANVYQIISVSLKPTEFGQNIVLNRERGILSMFKQILVGLENCTTDIVFLVEHDVLYHTSHFEFVPPRKDVFYYNQNNWKVDAKTGQALFYYSNQTSGLCAYRSLLLEHYRKRVEIVEREGFSRKMGFEPGTHGRKERVDNYKAKSWMSKHPNIDIRHDKNLTPSRWKQEQFRNKKFCQGWIMADEVPEWGQTKGRFEEFLNGAV